VSDQWGPPQREKAPREAKELSSILTSHFPYEKLYLFSSVLKNQRFTPHSDLDLVIKGLDRSLFLKAYAFLLPTSLPAGKFFLVDFSIFHSHGSFSPFVPCPRIDLQ